MHAERLRVAHLQDTSGGPHPWPGLDQRRWIPTAPAVDAGTASDHPGYQQFSAVTGRQVFPAGDGQVLYPPIAVRHQVSFMGITWLWSPRERMLIIGQSFPRVWRRTIGRTSPLRHVTTHGVRPVKGPPGPVTGSRRRPSAFRRRGVVSSNRPTVVEQRWLPD